MFVKLHVHLARSIRHAACVLAWLALLAHAPARGPGTRTQANRGADVIDGRPEGKNVESFEVVWKTIRDKHFDPTLGGLDWQAVHDATKPKVLAATTMNEARAADPRRDRATPADALCIIRLIFFEELENHKAGPGEIGLDLRLIDGRAVVSAVADDRAAHRAGVKPGWVIDKIGGKPVSQVLEAARVAYANTGLVSAHQAWSVISRLSGPVGSKIAVDFLDANDKTVHLDLTAGAPEGVPASFGNLPTFYVRFTARRLDRTVGYVSLNVFFDLVNVLKRFGEAIEANRDADGLIIDLRGNPGGIGAMSFAMAGWLVSEPGLKLGTMITRNGAVKFAIQPRRRPFKAPVAVLVDELSMSTSEVFAGGVQDLKRARIFGARTPGAALPSTIEVLPNGDRFQYAFANYISTGGKTLEGAGIVPDVETPLTRALLLERRDPAVEAAVRWIRSSKKDP